MNRRTTIKGILAFGLVAASGFSIVKWFKLNKKPDVAFLQSKKELIAELAEMIIPATDTPGAKEAKVGDFIIKMLMNCTATKNQNIFIEGLTDVEAYCQDHFNQAFQHCNQFQKEQVITYMQQKAYRGSHLIDKIEKKLIGQPFFAQLKELTVLGYFTSEPGATKGLAYDYIPGAYEACVKLKQGQKSWATK